MDQVTLFGFAAATFMILMYALQARGRAFILAFAPGCLLSSAYGFLSGARPFIGIEAIWAGVAVRRYVRLRLGVRDLGEGGRPGAQRGGG